MKTEIEEKATFIDNQKAHNEFWNIYERPPKEEFWDYILERRDLLVNQDVREYKGAFYTPRIWVEKSQEYLQKALGENYCDDYYIWDCAGGTGNLIAGLSDYSNVFLSTIDKQDVAILKDRIKNGSKILENHVFQFDFLNDSLIDIPCLNHKNKGAENDCKDCKISKLPKNLLVLSPEPW